MATADWALCKCTCQHQQWSKQGGVATDFFDRVDFESASPLCNVFQAAVAGHTLQQLPSGPVSCRAGHKGC
jgi:hypothetical protein